MSFKVQALDLDRVVQNILLYADPDAMHLREIYFVVSSTGLQSFSCDDYVAVTDSLDANPDLALEFALSIEDTEKLGAWIKKDKKVVHKYQITVQEKFTGISFGCDDTSTDEESDTIFLTFAETSLDRWDLVMRLLNEEEEPVLAPGFALRSDRLVKVARLKADKEAPIDIRFVEINETLIIQFLKGLTLRGAIKPVTRSVPKEEFLWPNTVQ